MHKFAIYTPDNKEFVEAEISNFAKSSSIVVSQNEDYVWFGNLTGFLNKKHSIKAIPIRKEMIGLCNIHHIKETKDDFIVKFTNFYTGNVSVQTTLRICDDYIIFPSGLYAWSIKWFFKEQKFHLINFHDLTLDVSAADDLVDEYIVKNAVNFIIKSHKGYYSKFIKDR